MSAVAITACEVQVSAVDSQIVPTVANGVSKPLCCRLTLTFTQTSEKLSLYTTLIHLLVFIQLCSRRCWHLNSNYSRTMCRQSQLRFVLSPLLLHLRLLGTFQSDIPLFTLTWPSLCKWENVLSFIRPNILTKPVPEVHRIIVVNNSIDGIRGCPRGHRTQSVIWWANVYFH